MIDIQLMNPGTQKMQMRTIGQRQEPPDCNRSATGLSATATTEVRVLTQKAF
jgi:hypothetical protein